MPDTIEPFRDEPIDHGALTIEAQFTLIVDQSVRIDGEQKKEQRSLAAPGYLGGKTNRDLRPRDTLDRPKAAVGMISNAKVGWRGSIS